MVKMYGVGMLGSYLTQGVYAVAGPFQAFGCAVDIIVVQQEDGTFKSSPWYVKFGDFQGGLKGTEKTVGISVNGARADFHMFLDNKGEACFEEEAECDQDLSLADTVLADELAQATEVDNSVETVPVNQRLKGLDITVDRDVGICADGAPDNAMVFTDTVLRLGSLDEKSELHRESISDLGRSYSEPIIVTVNTNFENNDCIGVVAAAAETGTGILADTGPALSSEACGADKFKLGAMREASVMTSAADETEEIVLADCKGTIAEKQALESDIDKMLEIFNMESGMEVGDVSSGNVTDELNYDNIVSGSTVWVSDNMENEEGDEAAISNAENDVVEEKGKEPGSGVVNKSETSINGGGKSSNKEETDTQAAPMSSPPSRWSMWPLSFRRSRASPTPSLKKESDSAVAEDFLPKNGYYKWSHKPKVRTYVPTSAQLASLKLKDGPNKVTFIFSQVLGKKTEVDARIYLWNWKTRIVISDVDGTITKSDVLGQVMPLVGRDWSQSGVTRLFSAIKDNGYEVLFLSARAISQAYLTRQFLLNLKQDGEALPEGPVFISPDGLFPSLYREVIKRSPHEFKIACLEDIKELFPRDVNPFYAGFGNRNTDEISYLKVGIPKGKIFIINPKGEVMVNHLVDTRTYTSLHALVDDMFPPVSSSEQEDFNSWNFWKLPLPDVEVELPVKSKRVGSLRK